MWSLKSTCNVREHFVSGADVSCCVGVADWECVLTDIQNFSEICSATHRFSQNHYSLVTTVNMERFTHGGMADMHLVYGSVNRNGRIAVWEHRHSFPNRRISQHHIFGRLHHRESIDRPRCPVAWPSRSPGLTCLDFLLWGQMKHLLYGTVVETEEDLVARITVAAVTLWTCQESSNGHDNQCSDDVVRA